MVTMFFRGEFIHYGQAANYDVGYRECRASVAAVLEGRVVAVSETITILCECCYTALSG